MADYPETGVAVSAGFEYDQIWTNHEHFAHGTVTLGATAATVVVDSRVQAGSHIVLIPTSAKAAVVVAGGTNVAAGIYASVIADGTFTLAHTDHADAEGSTFTYLVFKPKQIVTAPGTFSTP